MGMPWWVTAIGALFATVMAIIAIVWHGLNFEFAFFAFVAMVFWVASFVRDGAAVREFLVRIGTWWHSGPN